jgi:hypothetical protein
VLRSLAEQYDPSRLVVTVHLHAKATSAPERVARDNALRDLDAASIHFDNDGNEGDTIQLLTDDGEVLKNWQGFQNASSLGGAVRATLGPPDYARMRDGSRREVR